MLKDYPAGQIPAVEDGFESRRFDCQRLEGQSVAKLDRPGSADLDELLKGTGIDLDGLVSDRHLAGRFCFALNLTASKGADRLTACERAVFDRGITPAKRRLAVKQRDPAGQRLVDSQSITVLGLRRCCAGEGQRFGGEQYENERQHDVSRITGRLVVDRQY